MKKKTTNKEETSLTIQNSINLPVKQRKAMLYQVLIKLHTERNRLKNQKTKMKEKEVQQEIRIRIYNIIKNLLFEKFENKLCEAETIIKLHRMINICKDNLKKHLHCFEVYYSKTFTATFKERLLLNLTCIPFFGKFFLNTLIETTYLRFDFLLMMTITLSEILGSKQFLKHEFDDWKTIAKELKIELINFEMGQNAVLKGNKQIVVSIQTKKVAKTILNFGYHIITKLHNAGEIDNLEKTKLIRNLTEIQKKVGSIVKYVKKYYFKGNNKKSNYNHLFMFYNLQYQNKNQKE